MSVDDKKQTFYRPICPINGQCQEIQRVDKRIDSIENKLDVIMGGIITILITIIGSLLI